MIPEKYRDISIDQSRLDMELAKNNLILQFWFKRITKLTSERDKTRLDLSARESEKRIEIVSDPKKFKIDRMNNDVIDALITTDSGTINLQSDLIVINAELSEAYNYKDLFIARRDILNNLVKLWLGNYFANSYHPELERYQEKRSKEDCKEEIKERLDSALKKRKKNK